MAEIIRKVYEMFILESPVSIHLTLLRELLDFYHGSEHLYEAVELLPDFSKKERKKLYKRLRHILRHDPDGITKSVFEKYSLGCQTSQHKTYHGDINYRLASFSESLIIFTETTAET